jgi:hypothetical protein
MCNGGIEREKSLSLQDKLKGVKTKEARLIDDSGVD